MKTLLLLASIIITFSVYSQDGNLIVDSLKCNNIGIGTTTPYYPIEVVSDVDDHTRNWIGISSHNDYTRGFTIDNGAMSKWTNYVYKGEDGDNYYFGSGNSGRDVLVMQSGGRLGVNVPTLLQNVQILRIVQTGSYTYATITCETPHRLANNTQITIQGATTAKYNGTFIISSVTTMTFRITGLDVGAVSEEPTDAEIKISTSIPATLAIFPQYFDAIYSFDKADSTAVGTGYYNLTTNMRTSFGTADTIIYQTAGSYLYVGKQYPWRATCLDITVASVGSTAIIVQYSDTTGGWTTLTTSTTSGNSLVDGTNRLTQDGSIRWNLETFKGKWGNRIIQVDPAPHYSQNLYWIRIALTGTITTLPKSKSIGNQGVPRFSVYAQSGDVNPFFTIDYNGRVGILPAELETQYQLGTLNGLTSSKFEVVSEDGYKSDFVYYLANSSASQHPSLVMARSGGTIASKSAVINGMDVGATYGHAYDGSQFREIGKILFESASNASAGNASGRIVFFTRNATVASAERMRITETGYVGIGQTTPRSLLDVNGGVRIGNDADAAGVNKVGTFRYRADANNSWVEVCVQNGASSYIWKIINQETW